MSLLDRLTHYDDVVFRNTVFIESEAMTLFDDLSHDTKEQELALQFSLQQDEAYAQKTLKYNAIDYVFELPHWTPSRFGDGTFPIWYGSQNMETTWYETSFRWRRGLLEDTDLYSDYDGKPIFAKRSVFTVCCDSIFVDLRGKEKNYPELIDVKTGYEKTQQVGARLHKDGLPGLVSYSARCQDKQLNLAVLNRQALSKPKHTMNLLYRLELDGKVTVMGEKERVLGIV